MADILQEILAVKRQEIAAAKAVRPLDGLYREAEAEPPPRNFAVALRDKMTAGLPAVIAEIKKASPSRGVLRERFDPAAIATSCRHIAPTSAARSAITASASVAVGPSA